AWPRPWGAGSSRSPSWPASASGCSRRATRTRSTGRSASSRARPRASWCASPAEAGAEGARPDAEAPLEGAAEGVGAVEPGRLGGGGPRRAALEQGGARGVGPEAEHVGRRRRAEGGHEAPVELPRADVGPRREPLDREVAVEVVGDPGRGLAQRIAG